MQMNEKRRATHHTFDKIFLLCSKRKIDLRSICDIYSSIYVHFPLSAEVIDRRAREPRCFAVVRTERVQYSSRVNFPQVIKAFLCFLQGYLLLLITSSGNYSRNIRRVAKEMRRAPRKYVILLFFFFLSVLSALIRNCDASILT